MVETRARTLLRSLTYRLTAWVFTILWTWLLTDELIKSAGFATVLHFLLTIDYYLHERVWLRIKWGLKY